MKNILFAIHGFLSFLIAAFGFIIIATLLYFIVGHFWIILSVLVPLELIGLWKVNYLREKKLEEEAENEDCW